MLYYQDDVEEELTAEFRALHEEIIENYDDISPLHIDWEAAFDVSLVVDWVESPEVGNMYDVETMQQLALLTGIRRELGI